MGLSLGLRVDIGVILGYWKRKWKLLGLLGLCRGFLEAHGT